MFFLLSKLLDLFLAPLTWTLLLGVAALAMHRRAVMARRLLVCAVALLYAFSTAPVAQGLVWAAERGAERTWRPEVVYDAVIVLGGGLSPGAAKASGEVELNDAAERVLRGFELVSRGQARHVLVSGGALEPGVVEAEVLARMLEAWGVPPERILVEGESRNTHENAVFSERLLRGRGWTRLLLVTSAAHMPRALGCFRAVGLRPDALPVDHRSPPPGVSFRGWVPRTVFLDDSTDALRELAGRVMYRVQGYMR